MITNINKKVICVKDIPSNIIEEAFFILKSEVNSPKNEKTKINRKEIATREAEVFLEEYMKKFEKENQYKDKKSTLMNKIFGVLLIAIGLITISMILISLVIN